MEAPLIFLAFANNSESPLPKLERESENIYRTLTDGAKQQFFQLHREPFASIEKICHYLIEFKDRVIIFHYGGHAESEALLLTDQEADAKGVAQLLKGQKNLKLIFLNGCSTKEQVALLLQLGIPAVIATSSPIDDTMATEFAEQFYSALAKNHSIREAFAMAAGLVSAKGGKAEMFRGIKLKEEKSGFPWGLYTEKDDVLDWKLPAESSLKKEIIIRQAGDQFNFSKAPVNVKLTQVLLNVLRPFSKDLDYFLSKAESEGEEVDERILQRAIMDGLPAPVGEQVRKLFSLDLNTDSLDKIGVPRLEQLVRTYNSMVEFFAFVLLPILWEAKLKDPTLEIKPEVLDTIAQYLKAGGEQAVRYDYTLLIRKVIEFLDEKKLLDGKDLPLTIEELPALAKAFRENQALLASCQFMEEMKAEILSGKVTASEIESFCVQSEDHLCDIFEHLGFCARYKLNTIKSIDIMKPRNKSPRFRHLKVKLDTITAGYKDVAREYEGAFTDNRSVILLKEEKSVSQYLNLSPFIIDENALKGEEKSKLFFFNWYDAAKNEIHFKYAYVQKDELVLSDQYPEIREQFDEFCQLFFGKNLQAL